MKKNLVYAVVVMALALGLAVPSFAQYAGRINVTVPFSFIAENQRFAPGDYVVEKMANGRLRIHTNDGRVSASFLVLPKEGKTAPEQAHFIFRRYANEYFLATIWTSGLNTGWELLEGKAEREMAKNQTTPVTTAMLVGH